ncbi:MAG TPA: hypothetical protein VEX36_04970 [Thermoleophilaceae bacterium]|nr:hypothetical protein [Thermoleophilaceae bacterium]
MSKRIAGFLRHNVLGLIAIFIALTGTTIAATQAAKNSVGSKAIRNGQVKAKDLGRAAVTAKKIRTNAVNGAKVADDSLTGADIDETQLGAVPNASALGGIGRGDLNRGRTGSDDTCPVQLSTFVTCATVALTTPAPQRLLVLGWGEVGGNVSGSEDDFTECKLQVDDVDVGRAQEVGLGGTGIAGSLFPQVAVHISGVTEGLTPGAHTAEFECRNTSGGNTVFESQVSAVAIGSG